MYRINIISVYLKQLLEITQQTLLNFLCPPYTITMNKGEPTIIFQEDNVIIVMNYWNLQAVCCCSCC